MKIIETIILPDLVKNSPFAFILFLPFLTNQKQESGFQQLGGLVMRKTSVYSKSIEKLLVYSESGSTSKPFQNQ